MVKFKKRKLQFIYKNNNGNKNWPIEEDIIIRNEMSNLQE